MPIIYNDNTGNYEDVPDDDPRNPDRPQPAPTPPAPPANSAAAAAVAGYYNQYLGRAPNAGDVEAWLSGAYGWGDANNLSGIENGIRLSDEATRHRGAVASNPATTQYSTTPYTNFQTTGNDYSAFNTARQQDPGKSAKDAFVYLTNQAPGPPLGDKAALQQWFANYIQPGMTAMGHKVIGVNGDGFDYENGEGSFHVDFAQNAGAADNSGGPRRLQWNATPRDAATAARYAQSGGQAANSGGGGGASGGGGGASGGGGGGGAGYGGSNAAFPMLDIPSYVPYAEYTPNTFVNELGDYTPTEWVAPKPEDVYNDPSYQFRFNEGMKPVVNARALQGVGRGGATMKELTRYGQGFASNEFDRIYGRAADTYDRIETGRKGAYDTNYGNNIAEFNTNEANRFGAYGVNKGSWDKAYEYKSNEAINEYKPRFDWAKMQFDRDWDVYKFGEDNAFRYYNADLGAATTGAGFGNT